MEIILIRHGQSEHNARRTMALDSNLTELGQRQAETTADYLLNGQIIENPETLVVLSSPFRRTLQTSVPLSNKGDIQVHAYPRICEYFSDTNDAYNDFVGMTPAEIQAEFPFVHTDSPFPIETTWWPNQREDVHAIYRRACLVRDQLFHQYHATNSQVLLYSHAEPIGRLIEALQRVAPADGWPPWTENCGINRLVINNRDEPAQVIALNDTSHLKAHGIVSQTS